MSARTFSPRLPPHHEANALARALARLHSDRVELADLTESNPTRVGIRYPDTLLQAFADPSIFVYDPQPFGLPRAREAVAADHARRGTDVQPEHLVLTASTSEAYSWLFKLLCDPGDGVLVPQPSYPLFDYLAALEGVRAHRYFLEYHGRWVIDMASLASAPDTVRAVLVVSPNNPTGSYLSADELTEVTRICRQRGWALVVDEVFADYPLEAGDAVTDIALRADVLTFSLGGLSKTVGLPQMKLGWIVVGGPASDRDGALSALEIIADTFLSVATPVQVAASHFLSVGALVREAIQQRIRDNLGALRHAAASVPACEVLRVDGGWSAVIRVPSVRPEERLALELIAQEHIVIHPGYFFDFPREAYVIVSLLPEPGIFADAVPRLLRFAGR